MTNASGTISELFFVYLIQYCVCVLFQYLILSLQNCNFYWRIAMAKTGCCCCFGEGTASSVNHFGFHQTCVLLFECINMRIAWQQWWLRTPTNEANTSVECSLIHSCRSAFSNSSHLLFHKSFLTHENIFDCCWWLSCIIFL